MLPSPLLSARVKPEYLCMLTINIHVHTRHVPEVAVVEVTRLINLYPLIILLDTL